MLSNGETPALRIADAAMEALLPLQGPASPHVDAPPVPITRAEMEAMAGWYENRGAFVLGIESGRLVLRQNGGPPLTVAASPSIATSQRVRRIGRLSASS